jgi:FixJ family two-component response regulator
MERRSSPPGAGPTVSVIDPDEGVRHGLRSLLETLGLEVSTFSTAEEFIAQLDRPQPACLVTELDLPGMSGAELLTRLRETGIDIPIIMLATMADVPTVVRCVRLGAADFIEKPFVGSAVIRRVRQVLAAKEAMRAPRRDPHPV